jgi:hypothetical protein
MNQFSLDVLELLLFQGKKPGAIPTQTLALDG